MAQITLESFPAAWIGILLVGLAALALCVNQIDDFFERRKTKPSSPPNEQLESSHHELARRVQLLEDKNRELWQTMRAEDAKTRDEMAKSLREIERALGRIEGAINEQKKD